jgi:hypothetical protein
MASGPSEKGRTIRLSTELFLHIELVVYVALGILLSVTALLSLGSAALCHRTTHDTEKSPPPRVHVLHRKKVAGHCQPPNCQAPADNIAPIQAASVGGLCIHVSSWQFSDFTSGCSYFR